MLELVILQEAQVPPSLIDVVQDQAFLAWLRLVSNFQNYSL